MRPVSLLLLALLLLACGRHNADQGTTDGAGGSTLGTKATPAAAPLAADGLPADIPTTRTPAPSAADWEAAPSARVPSASPLGCEVNMIREWVRVNCGKRRSGAAPTGVQVRGSGCSRDTYTSMRSNSNLVTALSPKNRCEVEFTWGTERDLFVAEWSREARPALGFQTLPATAAPTASIQLPNGRPSLRR